MVNETKYGVISDIHRAPRIVIPAIEILKKLGAEKLILNGDIGNSQDFVGFVLNEVGKSGLESYIQPGSHEKLEDFEPVIEFFQNKYSNLINVFDNRKISCDGHDLIFMPGTDWGCGGEYVLQESGENPTGFYKTDNGNIKLINMQVHQRTNMQSRGFSRGYSIKIQDEKNRLVKDVYEKAQKKIASLEDTDFKKLITHLAFFVPKNKQGHIVAGEKTAKALKEIVGKEIKIENSLSEEGFIFKSSDVEIDLKISQVAFQLQEVVNPELIKILFA